MANEAQGPLPGGPDGHVARLRRWLDGWPLDLSFSLVCLLVMTLNGAFPATAAAVVAAVLAGLTWLALTVRSPWLRWLPQLGRWGLVFVVVMMFSATFAYHRRAVLTEIRAQLHPGISRAEVATIVQRATAAPWGWGVQVSEQPEAIRVRVYVGLASSHSLHMGFEGNRLVSAAIAGEDGAHDRFHDAPADLAPAMRR